MNICLRGFLQSIEPKQRSSTKQKSGAKGIFPRGRNKPEHAVTPVFRFSTPVCVNSHVHVCFILPVFILIFMSVSYFLCSFSFSCLNSCPHPRLHSCWFLAFTSSFASFFFFRLYLCPLSFPCSYPCFCRMLFFHSIPPSP